MGVGPPCACQGGAPFFMEAASGRGRPTLLNPLAPDPPHLCLHSPGDHPRPRPCRRRLSASPRRRRPARGDVEASRGPRYVDTRRDRGRARLGRNLGVGRPSRPTDGPRRGPRLSQPAGTRRPTLQKRDEGTRNSRLKAHARDDIPPSGDTRLTHG